MFKKFTALFLLTAFTHVYAVTPVQQSFAIADALNKSFDELNYKLNVEWDQSDAKFMDAAINNFEKEIGTLQKSGLTNKELVQHTLDKIKDKESRDEINEMTKIINDNQMSPDEARAFAISKLNSTYSHGTSWSGSRMGVHVALILGVIILIVCCTQKHKTDTTTPTHDPCLDKMPHDGGGEYGGYQSFQGQNDNGGDWGNHDNNCYPTYPMPV